MSRHTPRHKDKSSQKIGILTTSKLKMAMLGVVWKTPKIQVTRSQKNHPKPKEGRKKGIQKKKTSTGVQEILLVLYMIIF